MNIYISFVALDKKHSYSNMCIQSAKSLIKNGFPEQNIIFLIYGKKAHNKVLLKFKKSIVELITEEIPSNLKAWFCKPIAHYSFLNKRSLNKPFIYSMCDSDTLFTKNPSEFLSKQETDVLARGRERFMRSSNLPRLFRSGILSKPDNLDNFDKLKKYMGRTRAYLFTKYKINNIPDIGLYSDFVSIKDKVYEDVIRTWYNMFVDISRYPKYCTGDQEILCSAVEFLKISYSAGSIDFVEHFQSNKKNELKK